MAKRQSTTWASRHRQWLRTVHAIVKAMEGGRRIPLGPSRFPLLRPKRRRGAGEPVKVVICAPHPDDECLIGGLPLRLSLETGARVTNCAITLGSNRRRRAGRLRELESACQVLGFELVVPEPVSGFEDVNLATRTKRPGEWRAKVETLAKAFDRLRPDAVFAPHAEDWNSTHIGTHHLVVDALGAHLERSGRGALPLILTEFWHELAQPNLMIGLTPEIVAIELMATAEHGGEVRRNPYHLRQPSRLMNNVRRGSEVVGGQGGPAQRFAFAELYRCVFMRGPELLEPLPGGLTIGPKEKLDLGGLSGRFRKDS
ncbi:MAG: PIG-L family deacetylase [Acidobacteria bacterium]|nr:MAG: PIG-L family deacetylase [Acidobacteriota bacterium]